MSSAHQSPLGVYLGIVDCSRTLHANPALRVHDTVVCTSLVLLTLR